MKSFSSISLWQLTTYREIQFIVKTKVRSFLPQISISYHYESPQVLNCDCSIRFFLALKGGKFKFRQVLTILRDSTRIICSRCQKRGNLRRLTQYSTTLSIKLKFYRNFAWKFHLKRLFNFTAFTAVFLVLSPSSALNKASLIKP